LIKANVGVEVAFADIGGWDHHVNEVGAKASSDSCRMYCANLATPSRRFIRISAIAWKTW